MTQRQHDTRVALRRAVAIFGTEADDTRTAAVQFCYAHNIDPYWKTPIQRPISWQPPADYYDKPDDKNYTEQWEDIVAQAATDRSF